MKVSKAEAARHHDALLQAASRLFRERGFEGVSLAEVAAAAGLTHGAFYTHFDSKQALCAEAVETALRQQAERVRQAPDRTARISNYLSERHASNRAEGCPMAALGADVAREPSRVRAAFTRGLVEAIDAAEQSASPAGRAAAIATMSTMVGALTLARAVSDPKLRDEILSAARTAILGETA